MLLLALAVSWPKLPLSMCVHRGSAAQCVAEGRPSCCWSRRRAATPPRSRGKLNSHYSCKPSGSCRNDEATEQDRNLRPKDDGSYWLELRQSDGSSLVLVAPASDAPVLRYFQARMPYGLIVPDCFVTERGCSARVVYAAVTQHFGTYEISDQDRASRWTNTPRLTFR